MTQTLKSKKGVTLVELLAVIVILGIIAAIAVPAIGGLIERQRENAAEKSFEIVLDQAKTYVLGEGLAAGNTFDLADMIPGYLEESPIDDFSAANIIFTVVDTAGVLTANITDITGEARSTEIDVEIDGVVVYTFTTPAA